MHKWRRGITDIHITSTLYRMVIKQQFKINSTTGRTLKAKSSLSFHSYWIRVDGSGRITLMSHHFLKNLEIRPRTNPVPRTMPEPTSPVSNIQLAHPSPLISSSDDFHIAIGCPIESTWTYPTFTEPANKNSYITGWVIKSCLLLIEACLYVIKWLRDFILYILPFGLVGLRTFRLAHGLVRCKHGCRCSRACGADVSFRDVTINIPDRKCDQGCEWRHAPEAWAEIWEKSVSWDWDLGEARRICVLQASHVIGGRCKSQHRKIVSLLMSKNLLTQKVIKSFIPELRNRQVFSCFEIPTLSICALWTLWTFCVPVWICYIYTRKKERRHRSYPTRFL